MSKLSIFVCLAILAGCSAVKMYDKNGQINFGVTCNGASWIPCYQSASRVCKKQGYEILEKTGTKEHGFFTSEDTKEMIFTCK